MNLKEEAMNLKEKVMALTKRQKMLAGGCLAVLVIAGCAWGIPAFVTHRANVAEQKRLQAEQEAREAYIEEVTGPYASDDTILPNVYIGDVAVGGMTREEAAELVREEMQATKAHTITVHLPDQDVVFTSELNGLEEDLSDALDEACAYGRDDTDPAAFCEAVLAAEAGEDRIVLETEESVDPEGITDEITALAEEKYIAPVEDVVDIDTENLNITVTRGSAGRSLDAEGLSAAVLKGFENECYDDIDWEYDRIDQEEVPLEELFETYSRDPVNSVYDKTTGDVTESQVGYAPELSAARAMAKVWAAEPGEQVVLNFTEVEPEITADELREVLFSDVLYSYGSVYASNAGRTENLRLACAAINGTVINPGEVFSFNDTVGERTAAKGYQSAIVYVNRKSEAQLGGGICQVASTIYYCTLYAELETVYREPHMFQVTYVPNGMDATVYWGSLDYQFRNNTDYPIKINAYLSGGCCYIELVGTETDHHIVKMESVALGGLRYQVYRYVYDADGNYLWTDDLGVSAYSAHTS